MPKKKSFIKIILVLLDGVGDRSYPALNNLTPLEAARTPNLDRLASLGGNGLYHASTLGECLPSENAHFFMFGYEREKFPGRGLLEAVGYGVPFHDSDVLCLSHFSKARLKDGVPVLFKGRDDVKGTSAEFKKLYRLVSDFKVNDISFRLHQTKRNDGIIVINGDVSPYISDSDPNNLGEKIARVLPVKGNPEPEKASRTAESMNQYLRYCNNQLKKSGLANQANYLLTQRSGRRIPLPSFHDLCGLKPMMIASSAVYAGLAHEMGFTFVRSADSNDPGKDLKERIRIALEDSDHDFIHVHTKVTDEISHKGNAVQKKAVIEELDAEMDELVEAVSARKDLLVVVTGDHSTPSQSRLVHSGEPVPVIFAGSKVRRDRVDRFDEISAASGCLGLIRGRELMQMILNSSDRSILTGLCLGDTVRIYMPSEYPTFPIK
jgi:2,3-bisphosphoglycerate-independent phosphoglycerate mutase